MQLDFPWSRFPPAWVREAPSREHLPSERRLCAWFPSGSATYGKGRGGRGLPPSPQPGKADTATSCVHTTRGAPHSQAVHGSNSPSAEPHAAAFTCYVPRIDKCKVLGAPVLWSGQSPPMSPPSHQPLDRLVKPAPVLSYRTQGEGWCLRLGHLQRSLPCYQCLIIHLIISQIDRVVFL